MKQSVKYLFLLCLGMAVMLLTVGCQDDLNYSLARNVSFTADGGYQNGPKTKTAYSNEYTEGSTKYDRIDWVENDLIRVSSYEASTSGGQNYADYKVTAVEASSKRISKATVAAVEGNGLEWDHSGSNTFYAWYPSPRTSGAQSGIGFTEVTNSQASFKGKIPATQVVTLQSSTGIYQPDMRYAYMWAATTSSTTSEPINLAFAPAMTALEFTIGNMEGTTPMSITGLTLSSSSTALVGEFTGKITKNGLNCSYTCPAHSTSNNHITVNFGSAVEAVAIPVGETRTLTLLVLPQTLKNLSVTIHLDGGGSRTLALSNSSGTPYEFLATKKYHITLGVPMSYVYVFEVEGGGTVTYEGGSTEYKVTSYRHLTGSTINEGVAWTALEFSTDGGSSWSATLPDWLDVFTTGDDNPGTDQNTYNATIKVSTPSNVHTKALQKDANAKGTSENPYDLSTAGGTKARTTANCYVVGGYGYYKVPLYYGNGIVNGSANTQAYNPTLSPAESAVSVLTQFKKQDDTAITDPAISNATSAKLIWQDAQNLVTEISCDGSFLYFRVAKATICQGNAVIAVMNSGTILWSWHIWVTDQSLSSTVRMGSADYLPVNLGWCDGGTVTWPARNVRVRFTQEGSNEQRTLNFNQEERELTMMGNSPYYQWGRKDPFIPPRAIAGVDPSTPAGHYNKIWYDADGNPNTHVDFKLWENVNPTIGWAIQNPGWLILNKRGGDGAHGNWNTTPYVNMWNNTQNINYTDVYASHTRDFTSITTQKKTVYDPCPAGYVVPTGGVAGIPGMSDESHSTGIDLHNPAERRYNTSTNCYYYNSMYWPVLGNRLALFDPSGSVDYNFGDNTTGYGNYYDGYGKFWLADAIVSSAGTQLGVNILYGCSEYTGGTGTYMQKFKEHMGLYDGSSRSNAASVRCVKEY